MHVMHELSALDLNLLPALDALLQRGSVTAAASEIGRTQSATSHALNRLRHHFGDPLLIRDGWQMRLTPFAETLKQPVRDAVDRTADVLRRPDDFVPARSTRTLRIATRDICTPLLQPLVAHVARAAPLMRIEVTSPDDIRMAVLEGQADIGLRFGDVSENAVLEERIAYHLDWSVFAPAGHAYALDPSRACWTNADHVLVAGPGAAKGPIETLAQRQRLQRKIIALAPNFMAGLAMARDCNALFTTLRRPFEAIAESFGLVAQIPPFPVPEAPAIVTLRKPFSDPFRLWVSEMARAHLVD